MIEEAFPWKMYGISSEPRPTRVFNKQLCGKNDALASDTTSCDDAGAE
jgi:hypothetical protein